MEPFNIVRWDIVKDSCQGVLKPMIYFIPTLKSLRFLKDNDYNVKVKIKGTEEYNGCYFGVVDKSSNVPNCRPNFFDATQLYVITLDSDIHPIPTSPKVLGQFEFDMAPNVPPSAQKLINNPKKKTPPSVGNSKLISGEAPQERKHSNKEPDKLSLKQLLLIIIPIIILLLIIIIGSIFCFKKEGKSKSKN